MEDRGPRDDPFRTVFIFVSARWTFSAAAADQVRKTPRAPSVSMYLLRRCVWPLSQVAKVPLRNCSPVFAQISINCATENFFNAALRLGHPAEVPCARCRH